MKLNYEFSRRGDYYLDKFFIFLYHVFILVVDHQLHFKRLGGLPGIERDEIFLIKGF
jgi:hypothetical protein